MKHLEPRVPDNFEEWLIKNLIFCQDAHSFVHRIGVYVNSVQTSGHKVNFRDLQSKSLDIIQSMKKDYEKGEKVLDEFSD